jgi:Uma2 family endonuclease
VRAGRFDPEGIPARFIPFAPDVAIEILSPVDRPGEIAEKVTDYLARGTRVVWVVDPERRSVTIHRPDRVSETIGRPDVLEGADVVPGFACRLDEL